MFGVQDVVLRSADKEKMAVGWDCWPGARTKGWRALAGQSWLVEKCFKNSNFLKAENQKKKQKKHGKNRTIFFGALCGMCFFLLLRFFFEMFFLVFLVL